MIKLIKGLLEDNKKAWDSKIKFSLWDDQVTTKRSLGISPFHLLYGTKVVFSFSAGSTYRKILSVLSRRA
jgi:hypothetical protein